MTTAGDLDLLRDAALEAGKLALAMRPGVKTWSKEGGSPVTAADLAVDDLLKTRLLAARPDYGWLSEETADDPARLGCRRVFVVDPIDGTVAFIRGRPWWVVSVAVVEAGRPVAGVLVAPELDQTYEAETGGGARLNGGPIAPSGRETLEDAAVLGDRRVLTAPGWPPLRIDHRNSVAYRMAQVADGTFDAAVALSGKCDWDLAAADLIANEAGAMVSDHRGQAFIYNRPAARQQSLVCATPALQPLILAKVSHIELPN